MIIDRMKYYTDRKRDFAVFENGTCVILGEGLSDQDAVAYAKEVLVELLHAHPDMRPANADDGSLVVQYNLPAVNIVLDDVAQAHWDEIDANHLGALTAHEVLITPLGPIVFDNFGKRALFGRCFMFMDAQLLNVVEIERAG